MVFKEIQRREKEGRPLRSLVLAGHSMGGMELGYMLPLLEELFKQNKMEVKIDAALFLQSVGQYEQSLTGMIPRSGEVGTLKGEMYQVFPSEWDIAQAEEQLQGMSEKEDVGALLQKRRQIEMMRSKHQNPQFLTAELR